jgi:hypothetical protein
LENHEVLSKFESDETKRVLSARIPFSDFAHSTAPHFLEVLVARADRVILITYLPPRTLSSWKSTIEKFRVEQVVKWNSLKSTQFFIITPSSMSSLKFFFLFSYFIFVPVLTN